MPPWWRGPTVDGCYGRETAVGWSVWGEVFTGPGINMGLTEGFVKDEGEG